MPFGRLFFGLALGFLTACQSDAGEICERLEECGLLPTGGVTSEDPDGYTADNCEVQVEQKVNETRRERCVTCVTTHECGQIKASCAADCEPDGS